MKITAIIPAREGSKGIKNKNKKMLNNKPLIQYSIEQAQKSKYINDIVITTNDEDIKYIAENLGIDVPYLRPEIISDDLSTDYQFIKYHLDWCIEHNKQLPDLIVHLRPTYPLRNINIIDECISIMINNKYDSLRTIIPNDKTPFKMYIIENDVLVPLFHNIGKFDEPYNQPRQLLPQTYLHNGYLDIINIDSFYKNNSISGNNIYPYILPKNEIHDIDTIEDWNITENIMRTTNLFS